MDGGAHGMAGISDFFGQLAGAYTHYSYAIRDAIKASGLPAVEVHLSDIEKREPFRRISVTAPVCAKRIKGLGYTSYLKAIDFCLSSIKEK